MGFRKVYVGQTDADRSLLLGQQDFFYPDFLKNVLLLAGSESSAFYTLFMSPGQIKPYGLCIGDLFSSCSSVNPCGLFSWLNDVLYW